MQLFHRGSERVRFHADSRRTILVNFLLLVLWYFFTLHSVRLYLSILNFLYLIWIKTFLTSDQRIFGSFGLTLCYQFER